MKTLVCKLFAQVSEFTERVMAGDEVDVQAYARAFAETLEDVGSVLYDTAPEFHVLFRDGISVDDEEGLWLVPSSDGANVWRVSATSCDCYAARYGRRCRHRRALQLIESALPEPSSVFPEMVFSLGPALLRSLGNGKWELATWNGVRLNRFPLPMWLDDRLRERFLSCAEYDPFEEVMTDA